MSAPGFLLVLNEGGGNFRIIPIVGENERARGEPHRPSFQGSSVGHWEGDTLVVEATNFNGRPWLGAAQPPNRLPQTSSDALRIVERWSRPDSQVFEYRLVVEDQKMLTAQWTGPAQRRGKLPYPHDPGITLFPGPRPGCPTPRICRSREKRGGTR